MVVISKPLFYNKIGPEVHCQDVFHEWTKNCLEANLKMSFLRFSTGVFLFYLPLYLVKVMLEYKKINKTYWRNILKAYLRSESYGLTFGFLALNSFCLCNKLLGRLYYYNFGFVPGFISGLSICFEYPENRFLNTLIWSSLVLESMFNNLYYFKIVKYSRIRETFLFMCVSSILMEQLLNKEKNQIPKNIWFYVPSKRKIANQKLKESLIVCIKEIFKYFGFGYGLGTVKSFFSKTKNLPKHPLQMILDSFLSKKNFRLGTVVALYVGLFKATLSLLQKYRRDKNSNPAIAGFIAGSCYYIKPTMSMLTIAIVTVIQTLGKNFADVLSKYQIPTTEVIYMICNGILLHNRLAATETCPKYYTNMLKIASRGLIDQIYRTVVKKYIIEPS